MSTIQRAYKTELDPNATQTRLFFQYSGAVRFAYNWMLARREAHYKETGETIIAPNGPLPHHVAPKDSYTVQDACACPQHQ